MLSMFFSLMPVATCVRMIVKILSSMKIAIGMICPFASMRERKIVVWNSSESACDSK